jgi:hypothetical protein
MRRAPSSSTYDHLALYEGVEGAIIKPDLEKYVQLIEVLVYNKIQ